MWLLFGTYLNEMAIFDEQFNFFITDKNTLSKIQYFQIWTIHGNLFYNTVINLYATA